MTNDDTNGSSADIGRLIGSLNKAWEEFNTTNESRLREIEREGSADGLYEEHLSNISRSLDQYKSRLDGIEAERAGSQAGDEFKAVVPQTAYGKAFRNSLRKGMDGGLEQFFSNSLAVGSDPDGGYLVTAAMSQYIAKSVFEASPMRSISSVETISTDSLKLIDDHDLPARPPGTIQCTQPFIKARNSWQNSQSEFVPFQKKNPTTPCESWGFINCPAWIRTKTK